MNFKQFSTSDNQWHDVPYYQHKTATDTLTLPAVIYPNDTSITVGLKGNEEHTGTPSPQNPVMPNGTGERTANLLNLSSYFATSTGISDIVISGNSITFNASSQYLAIVYEFNLGITDIYTLALGGDSFHTRLEIRYTKNGTTVGSAIVIQPGRNAIISGSDEYDGFRVYISNANNIGTCTASNIMLNLGSEALPYEPYGIKIPISMGGTTNNVYLGEVQTVRQIKKSVLDGTESWTITSGKFYYITLPTYPINWLAAITSHFEVREDISATGCARFGGTATTPQNTFIFNYDNGAGGITAWKSYLAQQYANGTPVTVWYVLATPTTGITNEPLMKIGTYADSLTTSIPCTAGENTLDVQTTVAPSEVTAGFSGWHPVQSVHERENGQWD